MYEYNTEVDWIDGRRTKVMIDSFNLEVDSSKEFGGPEGQLSPETLLPSILASCILTTFLEFKDRMGIDLQKWESKVHATIGPSPEKGFRF
ncbi:MAG: OsmC family protein, partial [Thermoplasmata archaeon]